MHKRVFMIHGWGGAPEHGWFPWLKQELEQRGFEVITPQMPEANAPRIYNWIPKISEIVGTADENTYFVGHSMGCQAIVRYLETLSDQVRVGGIVFVAGFLSTLTGLEDEEEGEDISKHWLETPLDLVKVKSHLSKSVAIFSDNDEYVPLDNQNAFRNELGSKIIVEHAMGHFSGDDGITELPIALNAVLELAQ
jgi:predicted alpha/beta hydrolase family esterase